MGRMEEWAESLRYESLRQAADTFFGARRAVERDQAVLRQWAEHLQALSRRAETWIAALHCVLGGADNLRLLLDALGMQLPEARLYEAHSCLLHIARPHSFTREGLYCKIVWSVYAHWADILHEYHHGRPLQDSSVPGGTRWTPNYQQVLEFCARLNERIEHTNTSYRPSESLEFARRLDPYGQEMASLLGCGTEVCSLDVSLALPLVDPNSLGLLPWPDSPDEAVARRMVKAVCRRIFREQRQVAEAVLAAACRGEDKNLCVIGE